MNKYLALIAILPLLTMALGLNHAYDAYALKAQGHPGNTSPKNYGIEAKIKVCGDKLCSESNSKKNALEPQPMK